MRNTEVMTSGGPVEILCEAAVDSGVAPDADFEPLRALSICERRNVLRFMGRPALERLIGADIPLYRRAPAGWVPVSLLTLDAIDLPDGLMIRSQRPFVAEAPPHLLDDEVTPTYRHFIRNNGVPPVDMRPEAWRLSVDGLVETPLTLSVADLAERFEVVTERLVMECAGNGRAFLDPPTAGAQWAYGGVACCEWTGVRLADLLRAAGPRSHAAFAAVEGADGRLPGEGRGPAFAGVVPMAKALDPHTLIAFAQNGAKILPQNGAPLRLIVPGWPGAYSQKWLTAVSLVERRPGGRFMDGPNYRMPRYDVAPGSFVPDEDMEVIESMPVKSLITAPASGHRTAERTVDVRGHAWAGDDTVAAVSLSFDYGQRWHRAELAPPPNAYAWQRWQAEITLPGRGHYEIWARATDDQGRSQPLAPKWNPGGYLVNAVHRIGVTVV
ncbi:MAG: sulfite oxidase [Alphaproteobacteria bacterium]|nr:sulfite oxidase [Alphaproteobacteria bacterium]